MKIGLALVVAALFAIGFLPLFDGPGYEQALATGLVLPLVLAPAVALTTLRAGVDPLAPLAAVGRGAGWGAVYALSAWAVALLHGLRAGFCDVWAGTALMALGPGVGALLAGVWGAVAGTLAAPLGRPRTWAVALAALGPVGGVVVSLVRFWASPMVFAYDPFVGFFSGSLYDTILDVSGLVSYRMGSAATLLAVTVMASLARRDGGRWRLARPSLGIGALGLGAAVASLTVTLSGPRLGHWQTASTIADALGGRYRAEICEVIYPRTFRAEDVERFALECDGHARQIARWLEIEPPDRVTAFLFADPGQKGALMGAAETYIAKPWRREIYVQQAGYPHPVVGHELVHVLAGAFGRGPFRIAGALGGVLPDPGLVEGIAVAAEPKEGDLGPRDWAKAMKDLGLLPPLSRLFALGFLAESSATAYTVSGAFVGWVRREFGAAAVRAWYGGRALPEVVGKSWVDLEAAWHADLDTVELPPAARAQAKARFDKPGVFGRRCPHVVDECRREAERLRGAGDFDASLERLARIEALERGGDGSVRVARAETILRSASALPPDAARGRIEEARRAFEMVAADGAVPQHVRDRATMQLADLAMATGHAAAADALYASLVPRTLDEGELRTLEVKRARLGDARARDALVQLLVGTGGKGPDKVIAAELLGAWARADPDDGLPRYLLARHHLAAGAFREVAARLDEALALRLEPPRVRVEAERMRIVAACAVGDGVTARAFLGRYVAHPEVFAARRDAATSLVERCDNGGRGGPDSDTK